MQSAVFQVRFSLREREFLFYPGMNILNFNVNAGVMIRESNVKQFNLTCPIVYEYSPPGLIVKNEIPVTRTAFPSAATPFGYLLRVDSQGDDAELYNSEFLVRPATFLHIIQEDRNSRKDGISYFDFKPFLMRTYQTDVISFPPVGFTGVAGSYGTHDRPLNRTEAIISNSFISTSKTPLFKRIYDASTNVDFKRKNNTILNIITEETEQVVKPKIHEIEGIYSADMPLELKTSISAIYPQEVLMKQNILISFGGGFLDVTEPLFGVNFAYKGNTNIFEPKSAFSVVFRVTIG